MILECADWRFDVDLEATRAHTTKNASDHCECGYCKNYYETLGMAYPDLCFFLDQFGISIFGPSELMPFEPTLMLSCYRVYGAILQWGKDSLCIEGIPVVPEAAENGCFFLWIGEIPLPWVQSEDREDVVSPANLPEFLERMQEVWILRHGEEFVFS